MDIKFKPNIPEELYQILKERLKFDKNANLNDIDVSNIKSMNILINPKTLDYRGIFWDLDPHNIDISKWNVSNVENMWLMFDMCENFNCDLSEWNVHNVKDMDFMFYGCKKFNCNLDNWDISNLKSADCMFDKCISLINKPKWYKN